MTHTPASTPLALETTPPISSLLSLTAALCCAVTPLTTASTTPAEKHTSAVLCIRHLLTAHKRREQGLRFCPGRLVYNLPGQTGRSKRTSLLRDCRQSGSRVRRRGR